MYDVVETPEQVSARFGLPLEWARMHVGRHVCVDGRNYITSCLVTDPSCDHLARHRLDLPPLHRRYTHVLSNSAADIEAGRDLVDWVGVSDATLADFDAGIVHGRRVEADGNCTPDCPAHHCYSCRSDH